MSRYGGFFSPRKLRNRINFGNFSQIACSPDVTMTRALSPLNMKPMTNVRSKASSRIDSNTFQNSTKIQKLSSKVNTNSGLELSKTKQSYKLKRLVSVIEKYKNMKDYKGFVIDDSSLWNQQNIESYFSL